MTTPLASNRAPQSPAEFKAWATSMLAPTGDLPALLAIVAVCRRHDRPCVEVAERHQTAILNAAGKSARIDRSSMLAMIRAIAEVW